jgi:hypothetical protein
MGYHHRDSTRNLKNNLRIMGAGALGAALTLGGLGADMVQGGLNRRHANRMFKKQVAYDESVWKKNRESAVADYGRNRQDALADWQMQNKYDSPEQQMARFKEAGLNPNLIYGSVSSSQGGTMQTPTMDTPDYKATAEAKPSPTNIDFQGAAQGVMQAESIRLQQQNAELNAELIKAQTLKVLAEVDTSKMKNTVLAATINEAIKKATLTNMNIEENIYSLRQGREESKQRIAQSQVQINKILADTKYTIDENKRKELMASLQRGKVTAETELITQKIVNAMLEEAKITAQTAKTEAEKRVLDERVKLLEKQLEWWNADKAQSWLKALL